MSELGALWAMLIGGLLTVVAMIGVADNSSMSLSELITLIIGIGLMLIGSIASTRS